MTTEDLERGISGSVRPRATTFGRWVTKQRERLGLTKTECAARTNPQISVQRWAQIEYANPRNKTGTAPQVARSTVLTVADALRVPHSEALVAAGYVPDEEIVPEDLVRYWNDLNDEGRRIASAVIESLSLRREYRSRSSGQ